MFMPGAQWYLADRHRSLSPRSPSAQRDVAGSMSAPAACLGLSLPARTSPLVISMTASSSAYRTWMCGDTVVAEVHVDHDPVERAQPRHGAIMAARPIS